MSANGWRIMWVIAMFDVPVGTVDQRRAYQHLHDFLLKENFVRHQYSVYLRHLPTMAVANAQIARVRPWIPDGGHVTFFLLTDKQYGMTREFFGWRQMKKKPDAPQQVELF
jgi:CRISPR-associated protein Cas2